MLNEMVELGYKGGKVRIGHCQNAALALELCTEIQQRFPEADVRSYPLRGRARYYAERGGITLGFEVIKAGAKLFIQHGRFSSFKL